MVPQFRLAERTVPNQRVYSSWRVGRNRKDIFYNGSKVFAARLAANGVPYVYKEYRGAHVMPVFRQQLDDVLPLLFK